MMFYQTFMQLCTENDKSPTAVGIELGFSRATVSGWKNGAAPRETALLKIANYFGVSVEYLKGENAKKEQPTVSDGLPRSIIELQKFVAHLSEEEAASLLAYLKATQRRP